MLDHERLEVYALARQLSREGAAILREIPPGRADLVDQLRRASLSFPLNIAEGAGEFAPKEKARFYRIAKRSATECSAILDHMVDIGLVAEPRILEAKKLIHRIVGGTVRLILSTESRPPNPLPLNLRLRLLHVPETRPPVSTPAPSHP